MLVRLTVDRFCKGAVVLKSEDNFTFVWPQAKLPQSAKVGSVLVFNILGDCVDDDDSRFIAREILNEILNTS